MVILIGGATHTGKTVLAQRLLETYHYPYLSIDHIKMGLIRSGQTVLTPMDDEKLTDYLWPILREIIKTAIENRQNLIIEGCYIPYDWKKDFSESYLQEIRCRFLVMSEDYIRNHFDDILNHASDVEKRLDDSDCTAQWLIEENRKELEGCRACACPYILIDENYEIGASIWPT